MKYFDLKHRKVIDMIKIFVISIFSVFIFLFNIQNTYASDINTILNGITLEDSGSSGVVLKDDVLSNEDNLDFTKIFLKYKTVASFITAGLTITSLFMLFVNIGKLSTSLDNEFSRKKVMVGIATSAVGVAIMGSSTIVIAFFYQFFG